jgi:hypothetical protein
MPPDDETGALRNGDRVPPSLLLNDGGEER